MVAELQPFVGDDHATLLCFSSDVGEWVNKTWVDLSWCIVACDPFPGNPHLAVLPLPPPAKPLNYGQAAAVLDRYRALGVSDGKLRFVDIGRWSTKPASTTSGLTAHPTYKAAGLPTKIPVLALIHPDNPAVVYFFLDHHLFGVDLRDRTVVACDLYHLVNPPTDLVSTSFVHAWQLPKALLQSPNSPGRMSAFVHAVASCYGSEEAAAALSPASLVGVWAAAGWLELGAGRGPCGLACAAEDCFFQEVVMDHGRAVEMLRSCAVFLGGEVAGPAVDLLARCLEVLAASTDAGFDGAGASGRSCDGGGHKRASRCSPATAAADGELLEDNQ
ncbi:uncharacterized protein C2845_PM08G00130 [Panicum miliaceum]|uniref:DUF1618 domain-containing protein n=1 Tax=Panicum miliaceum TaxID=4540 RepID=A0A3L6QYR8_PANMI|nr:uncharacterized protein C2845_PM08G00130 [Panicum miliaceum]